jgi:hypothetical protein
VIAVCSVLLIAGANSQQIKVNTERLDILESKTVTKEDITLIRNDLRQIRREIGDMDKGNTSDHSTIKERLTRLETRIDYAKLKQNGL